MEVGGHLCIYIDIHLDQNAMKDMVEGTRNGCVNLH
jgi:hypothetical protein